MKEMIDLIVLLPASMVCHGKVTHFANHMIS